METPKGKSLLEFLAFKKKTKQIWREEMGFIYHLLLFSYFFLIFFVVVFSPLHELISFSRVFDVV